MTDPLPCPFCGSKDLKVVPDLTEDDDNHIYAYHVHCRDCHATGRNNYPIGWCESEQDAIEAWNDRFTPATIPGDCDRVQLSTTALLHLHRELETIVNIKDHIADLLTPLQMESNVKNNEKVMDDVILLYELLGNRAHERGEREKSAIFYGVMALLKQQKTEPNIIKKEIAELRAGA